MVVAAVLLLLFVLPAEYGWDPTGIGGRLGLTGLAAPEETALQPQGTGLASQDPIRMEMSISLTLPLPLRSPLRFDPTKPNCPMSNPVSR